MNRKWTNCVVKAVLRIINSKFFMSKKDKTAAEDDLFRGMLQNDIPKIKRGLEKGAIVKKHHLVDAIFKGDVDLFNLYLSYGIVDINGPLMSAALEPNRAFYDILLAHGASRDLLVDGISTKRMREFANRL